MRSNFLKLSFLSASVIFSLATHATIRTVNNNLGGGAQYSNLQTAVNAAADGDTILISGSTTNYGTVTFADKKLALFGPGFAPTNQLGQTATLGSITINETAATGNVGGSEIQGLTITSAISLPSHSITYSNIKIHRNYFSSSSSYISLGGSSNFNGISIENNYFFNSYISSNGSPVSNLLIQNNVFNTNNGTYSIYGFSVTSGVLINHNVFYGSNAAHPIFSTSCIGLIISNNIFSKRDVHTGLSSSFFQNNLTFNCSNNTPWSLNSNVDAGGNIANQDPQMVDQVAVNAGTNSYILNLSIAAGPANNSATDGKDLGVLYDATGAYNWDNARRSRIPYVNTMVVNTLTVAPGGNVSVTVEAKKSN